jgi:putative nucleotidyltransferase-like protein
MSIPPRLVEPVRAALRGEAGGWPATLTGDEVRTLVEHGIAPLLYSGAQVPQLRAEAMRSAAVEPLRADDLREVLAGLAAHGVEALILKGSALAYEIYPAPELRPRSDCDLLIAEDAIEAMREAMREAGFRENAASGDEHGNRQSTFVRAGALGLDHAYDVHWAVTNSPLFASILRFDDLRSRAVAIPALGPHAKGLSRPDALLLASIHRVVHHHDSDRLIWLVDIALLRDRMCAEEHRAFWRMAAEVRAVAVCSRSIALANEWLSRPHRDLAEDWLALEELRRDEPSRAFLDREITLGGVMLADMRALPWRTRLARLRQLAFPPADFMRQSFPARGRVLLPLLYVYRGARGVLRLFRRVRA